MISYILPFGLFFLMVYIYILFKYGMGLGFILFMMIFITESNFRYGRESVGEIGFDDQMLFKAGVWIFSIIVLTLWLATRKRLIVQSNIFPYLLLLASMLPSVLLSPVLTTSFLYFIVFSLFIYFALIVSNAFEDIWYSLWASLFWYLLLSLVTIFIFPDLGYMDYWLPGDTGSRFTGLSASANGLGRIAAIFLIFSFFNYIEKKISIKILLISLALGFVLLFGSWSRTSIVFMFFSIFACYVFLYRKKQIFIFGVILFVISLALMTLIYDLSAIASLITRTGDLTELFTLTGRTDIWRSTVFAIRDSYIFGYGYGSSKILLPIFFVGPWGFITESTHNLILQVIFSVGFFGFMFFCYFLYWNFKERYKDPIYLSVFVFLMLVGITEASFYGPTPNAMTLVFLILAFRPFGIK